MASTAAADSRAELAATLCLNQFVSAPDAFSQLQAIRSAKASERDALVASGGWAVLPGGVSIIDGSIDRCAERIASLIMLPERQTGEAATRDIAAESRTWNENQTGLTDS